MKKACNICYKFKKNMENSQLIEPCNKECSFCFLNYTDVLKKNYLFKNLYPNEIGEIIREIHHQVKQLEKGEILAVEGEELHHLMIIVKGSVVGEMMDFEGNIIRVEKLRAPETVATAFLFGESGKLPVTITATEESKFLLIKKNDLLELFRKNPVVLKNFLSIISDRAQFMSRRIKLLSLTTIKGKISTYLLDLVKKNRSLDLILPHSQQELAEIFGVSRPSVGRTFREMHENGCIEAKGKQVKILDTARLSDLLKGE